MQKTKIPWADYTWNPITGCAKISEGCEHCYAHALAGRFNGGDFSVKFHPERLSQPEKIKKPSRIFVCSMSDLFHEDIKTKWILEVMNVCAIWKQHTFIILTKRPARLREYFSQHSQQFAYGNIWLGVTAENQKRADERIPILLTVPVSVNFVSVEPMLEPVTLKHYIGDTKINWVIAGPESGPQKRECKREWIDALAQECKQKQVAFFDKRPGAAVREFPIG